MNKSIIYQGNEYEFVSDFGGRGWLGTTIIFASKKSFGVSILEMRHDNFTTGPEFEIKLLNITSSELEKIIEIKNGLVAATTETASKEINDTYIVPQEEQNHEHAPL